MEPRLQRSEWYNQSLPTATAPPPKKRHTGWKIAGIIVGVLALIFLSTYAVSHSLRFLRVSWTQNTENGDRPYAILPTSEPDDEFPSDFRDYFDRYFQSSESTTSGSHLKRVAGASGVAVEIVSPEGKPELSLQELYQLGAQSIVGIEAYRGDSVSYAWGTGVVLTEDGYIITNEHVIDESDRAVVVLSDGREFDALLVGEDTQTDIAVLKVEAKHLVPAEFGDSAALSVGDRVAAIGNPLGDTLTGTMTDGIVSAINRDIQMNGHRMTLIQTNAALNEGNSGGPLFNMYGQVVGITNMKMVNRYSDVTVEGIGFAIPSATVKAVTDRLIASGIVSGRPALGITVGPISEEAASRYGLPEGLIILKVSEGSDAMEQGVQKYDVLTHVNGQKVVQTTDVLEIRDQCAVGDTMTLTLWREGKSFDVTIVLRDMNDIS